MRQQTLNASTNGGVLAYRLPMTIAAILICSGCVHLALLAVWGASWGGPLSLRKPALFGISGGLTVWSLTWLMTQLHPRRIDRLLASSIAVGLLVEVALITMQYWRGVASHFNTSTPLDAAVETSMLVLILAVTGAIVYLTLRTTRLRDIERSMGWAIQGGMWLLALSCVLGIGTSVLGHESLSTGRSYEVWGRAGVLKFPHGVALHAIQLLPIVAWIAQRIAPKQSVPIVQSTLASQIVFMVYAIWQTAQGRDRFDWDSVGGVLLAVTALLAAFPVAMLAKASYSRFK